MTTRERTLVVSSPYREGAARALIACAAERGALGFEIVPRPDAVARAASIPLPRRIAGTSLGRRARALRDLYATPAPHPVRHVSHLAEVILRAGLRLPAPGVVLRASYLSKVLFDRAAARLRLPEDHTVLGFPGACLATFRARPEARRVFHAVDAHPRAHNGELLRYFSRRRSWDERFPPRLVRRIEKELRLADVVLTPSAIVTEQMIRFGVDPSKIVEIPYGVNMDGFTPIGAVVPRDSTRPRLICAAHVSLRKGFPQLLEAVRGIDVDLVLAGGVFDRRILRSAPSNVTVRGLLSHDDLAREYRSADAFVLPTLEDACSLVVAEAAACGLPIITSDANGASALLDPQQCRILPAGDVAALRAALASVTVLDRTRREANAARARSTEGTESGVVDWPTYATRVLDVILAL